MKGAAGLCLLVFVTAAVALPMQWVELQPAKTVHNVNKAVRLGQVWSNCSKPTDPLHLIKVTLSPDPPAKGKNLIVSVEYSLTEEVTGGELKVSVKYGILPIFDKTLDLCEVLKDAEMSCPIKPGSDTITMTQAVPNDVPDGHYTGNLVASDQKGTELACIDLDIHF